MEMPGHKSNIDIKKIRKKFSSDSEESPAFPQESLDETPVLPDGEVDFNALAEMVRQRSLSENPSPAGADSTLDGSNVE